MKLKNFINLFDFLISFSSAYLILTFSVVEKSLMPLIIQNIETDIYLKLFLASLLSIVFLILNKIFYKLSNIQNHRNLLETLIFITVIFSTFYMLRLFSLSRLFIVISLTIFLFFNLIYKKKLSKDISQIGNVVFIAIFITFFSYLTLQNINNVKEDVFYENNEFISLKENDINSEIEINIYNKNERNYKEFVNTYVGTYILNNTYELKKFKICCEEFSYFDYGQKSSGAISIHDENIYLVSGNLVVQRFNLSKIISSTTDFSSYIVPTNIESLIKNNNLFENNWESLKDMIIIDNFMYLSYLEENTKDCINIQVVGADIRTEPLIFNIVFKNEQCVSRTNENFNAHQGGGKMLSLGNNKILLSIGDFRQYELAQNTESIFGKIILIDLLKGDFEIISIGNRNPQGLSSLKNNEKYILETEHGPRGGDEINIISLEQVNNYGWPISSYGDHYDGKVKEIAPLYKSHSSYGFEEPLYYFPFEIVGSHGISDIEQNHYVENNNYFVATLNGKKIYDIRLSEDYKSLISISEIFIGERIRNIIYNSVSDVYFLLLEDTPSIAVFSKKD